MIDIKQGLRLLIIMLIGSLLTMSGLKPAYAENSSNEKISLTDVAFETCEESVAFEGNVHYIQNVTVDQEGGHHIKIQWNYANAKGIGMESGVRYVLTAMDNLVLNVKTGQTQSGVFHSHVIALGQMGSDFMIHGTFHVTVDADGNVISEVTNLNASCYEN
ncbi:hypothetical protein [Metabacillus sp. Hm71]|uniref:hypothetical protein n=1 Tax=Metabacillus sp. Hm71 TaxID=3450743 RepID=UPI003F41EA23